MEDVTEVIVEPEPGEDEPTSGETDEDSGRNCTESSLVGNANPDRADTTESSLVSSCQPARTEDQSKIAEKPFTAGQSPPESQPGSASRPRRSVAFFAVFDGHGGREAAQFARDYLWEFVKKQRGFWSDCDREVCSAIRKGFVACHHAMWKKLRKFARINNNDCSAKICTLCAVLPHVCLVSLYEYQINYNILPIQNFKSPCHNKSGHCPLRS